VERVVRGGATASPKYDGPVPEESVIPYLVDFVKCNARCAVLLVLATKVLFPRYSEWVKAMLAKGYTEERAFAYAATAAHLAIYFSMFGFYEFIEYFGIFRQYKLARTAGQEPALAMKTKTVVEFLVSQVLNFFALGPVVFRTLRNRGASSSTADLPSNMEMFNQFAFANVFNRITFALAHRAFHHGPLYRAIHKKHHQYVGTVSIAAENAHPVEAIIANAIPSIGGCMLLGSHPLVFLVWLSFRLEETYEAHSGYCFVGTFLHRIGLTNSEHAAYHDYHHVVNKGNFGVDPFMDFLMGTNDHWRANGHNEGYIKLAREQNAKEE
jgi:sterol desaturase/sphingolipid hydroxylase (fatty acid hydroxylase superfamily)